MKRRYQFSLFVLTLTFVASATADSETPGVKNCPGMLYRSKKEGIPVYDTPDLTAKVLRKLELGEKVCRIGEVGQFQILRWDSHSVTQDDQQIESSNAYARTVDLGEAREAKGREGMVESVTRFFKMLFSGGMSEDPLLPYRPVMNSNAESSSCTKRTEPEVEESTCRP